MVVATVLVGLGMAMPAPAAAPAAAPADAVEHFEKKVRPVLVEHCYKCHSSEAGNKIKGGFQLDTAAGLLKGGDSGDPAVIPGDPDKSPLIVAVRYQHDDLRMPPKGKLPDSAVEALVKWVRDGAVDPRKGDALASNAVASDAKQWWAFQPPAATAPPAVHNGAWVKTDIDRFILAAQETKGLAPSPLVDRRTLIRRATYDLTGLPPTDSEVEVFLADGAPDAFSRVVDRLLASPRYGERWGRHWLDLVRYTDSFDSRGLGGPGDCSEAWRYRDWVVKAFNNDLPYDRFLTMQLAGDLLKLYDADAVVATTILAIGDWGNGDSDKQKQLTDIVDDQVDLVGRAFLGMTIACARCHDHKFDPFTTEDYYSLAGIFFSSHINPNPGPKTAGSVLLRVPLMSPQEKQLREQQEKRLAEVRKEMDRVRDASVTALAQKSLHDLPRYILAVHESNGKPSALERIARERGLNPSVLQQWFRVLGPRQLNLLTQRKTDIHGKAGLVAWVNSNTGTPSLTANTTGQEQNFITISLPPRSIAVHPSPSDGVGVAWQSPITGQVRITGRVRDADDKCGNGIEWQLRHRSATGEPRVIASGAIDNGSAQAITVTDSVAVKQDDLIDLLVLPRGDYSCDTTVIEFDIADLGTPTRQWNLTRDVLSRAAAANPDGAWRFFDAAVRPAGVPVPADLRNALWQPDNEKQIEALARDLQAAFQALAKADQADRGKYPEAGLFLAYNDPRSPFWSPLREDAVHLTSDARQKFIQLQADEVSLTKSIATQVPVAHAIQDGGCPETEHAGAPRNVRVHIRGRYDRLGEVVPRGVPSLLNRGRPLQIKEGSGRLELAQWLTDPASNPQFARVMVNRIWQHHFGDGLVRTSNNYGKLGTPPTHPQLLDHLAIEFQKSGWSIKAMHRAIMLSSIYQQSGRATQQALQIDPDNALLTRFPRRRLEAEALRDSLLAASGKLDVTMGGPAIRDLASPRRTLYLMTIRSDRSGYRTLFDAADPNTIAEKRTDSTVAPQALFLLNHPFVLDQAGALAAALQKTSLPDDAARVDWLYRRLFCRPPTAAESEVALRLLRDAGAEPWPALCHVLLCSNEFLYID